MWFILTLIKLYGQKHVNNDIKITDAMKSQWMKERLSIAVLLT